MTKEEFYGMSLNKGLKLCVFGQTRFEDYITKLDAVSSDCQLFFSNEWNNIDNSEYFKPILYPLDYLTKPITHNGETFVPSKEIIKYRPNDLIDVAYVFSMNYLDIASLPLWVVLKLIEWRFNLMDKSEEFIDVTTLPKNPYEL